MRLDLLDKYDLRLPRYTSYPTAPHFTEAVNGETYGRWLGEMDPATELSLYLHISYCAEMCFFCGCHTSITKQYKPVAVYLETLLKELDLVAHALPGRMTARHIHFGGGSPTILKAADFVRLVDRLRANFAVLDKAEIAVELDPRTADEAYVEAMARSGVTRASIGVQDFNAAVQKAINRIQPFEVTERVITWLRKHGVPEVNMDLVYGLPLQTTASMVETVEKAVAFKPKRLTLFGYAHVPWMKKHMRLIKDEELPDAAERWRQYEACHAVLAAAGYVQIGLDHFAAPDDEMAIALKDNTLHRNFQGYTTDTASVLLGFGASGIGSLPQGYVANEGGIHAYQRMIEEGRLATVRGVAVSAEDCLRREIIERLMCDLHVDLDAIAERHGVSGSAFEAELAALEPMEKDGMLKRTGRSIEMLDDGRALVRVACSVFDTYLKRGEKRHSQAV